MKRVVLALLALFLLVGCDKEEQQLQVIGTDSPVFTTSFEEYDFGEKTKTYVDEDIKLLWHAEDELSIFTTTRMGRYIFDGETGDNNGAFSQVPSDNNNQFVTGNAISANYAIYPYSSSNGISNKEVITTTLPAVQKYAENSFGRGANTMVAVTSGLNDYFLPFKNVGGYLVIKLYGDDVTVKKIKLQGNNGEKLSGKATVKAEYGKMPVVEMAEDAIETVEIDCGSEGVKLSTSKEEPTQFWFVVPPTIFGKGFTITIYDRMGGVMEQSTRNATSVERNVAKSMQPFKVVTERRDITVSAWIYAATSFIDKSNYLHRNGCSVEGTRVQFKELNTGEIYETTVGRDDYATVNIKSGNYSIELDGQVEYNGKNCIVRDLIPSIYLIEDIPIPAHIKDNLIVMRPRLMPQSSLIFSELYYCGAPNYYFRDQTYQIYNNGNKTEYLDGLCFAQLHPNIASATSTLPIWPDEDGIDNFVYGLVVWQFPGNGRDYPLEPGESVILAQEARDHTVNNPDSYDNSMANWECWSGNISRDNPDVANMPAIFTRNLNKTQWLTAVFGSAFCLYRPDDGTVVNSDYYDENYDNLQTEVNKTQYYAKIPVNWIYDGVELLDDMSHLNKKRIPYFVDLGATSVERTYCNKVVSRRVVGRRDDGTPLFADTNNSTVDFEVLDYPAIRRNGEKTPAWAR